MKSQQMVKEYADNGQWSPVIDRRYRWGYCSTCGVRFVWNAAESAEVCEGCTAAWGYGARTCSADGCSAVLAYPDEGTECEEHRTKWATCMDCMQRFVWTRTEFDAEVCDPCIDKMED